MSFKQLFATKSLETLKKEAEGDNRLRRVLGPVQLSALGIGAIIGAGIFVMTGRAAAQDAGPAIMLSYCVAGLGCALAAFCYAEFASLAPVAGSAYTYSYATLGELMAWIIGWDLILEYAMACACVAAAWANYFNELLKNLLGPGWVIPDRLINDPFSFAGTGLAINLPAVLIMAAVTVVLVIGIRESAIANAILTTIKLGVVIFVIGVGWGYVNSANWTDVPLTDRSTPVETYVIPDAVKKAIEEEKVSSAEQEARVKAVTVMAVAAYRLQHTPVELDQLVSRGRLTREQADTMKARTRERFEPNLATDPRDKALVERILVKAMEEAPKKTATKWGILAYLGLNTTLSSFDDSIRSNFLPFGISGLMLGASIVFFAFIGFDSISTQAEEARVPHRDVPIAIITSLVICTVLYLLVSAVITGMVPYPDIDRKAAIASAFSARAEIDNNPALKWSAILISLGALAGMTSVLLITFLSQARIFLAMARDGLMPASIFAAIHEKYRTPHISTMLTGAFICFVAAFTPIGLLEEMVNIGTLLAFVIVCGAVWILRIRRPEAPRPFRCPAIHVVAPLGIAVNLLMMLFLPLDTWIRLVGWLGLGLLIYFSYGLWHSKLGMKLRGLVPASSPDLALAGMETLPKLPKASEEGPAE